MTELIEFRKEKEMAGEARKPMTVGEARTAKDDLDKAILQIIEDFEEKTELSVITVQLQHKESFSGKPLIKGLSCQVLLHGFEK